MFIAKVPRQVMWESGGLDLNPDPQLVPLDMLLNLSTSHRDFWRNKGDGTH